MNSIMETIPQLTAYQPALLALAVLCFVLLTQNLLTAPLAFANGDQSPGAPLRGDHTSFSFRVVRTHLNSVEAMPAFGLSLLIAILVGVNSSLVNWVAAIHVVARLGFWAVYYSGVGKVAGGPRTLFFVGGMASNVVLTGACIYTLLV